MQIKPQTVEAVLFFNDGGVCKEMLYPEFEAVLDGMVSMPEFADQQMRVVYVLINTRLQIRAAVFFFLDFNEDGSADSGWNIPLRNLAERTGRGPDLGAGPIRLACRSQCPVSWYQMHLWDPELTQSQNHLVMLRGRIKRNQLGLLVEEDTPQAVPAERLQMVAEDAWYAADSATQTSIRRAEKLEQEQRLKAAQLIKQQRLRIASLEQQREADISRLRELAAQQQAKLLDEIAQLRQELLEKEGLVEQLQVQLHEQAEGFQKNREEMSRQLRALEQNGRAEADANRSGGSRIQGAGVDPGCRVGLPQRIGQPIAGGDRAAASAMRNPGRAEWRPGTGAPLRAGRGVHGLSPRRWTPDHSIGGHHPLPAESAGLCGGQVCRIRGAVQAVGRALSAAGLHRHAIERRALQYALGQGGDACSLRPR